MLTYIELHRAVKHLLDETPEDRTRALIETPTFAEFVRQLVDERYEQLQQQTREDDE